MSGSRKVRVLIVEDSPVVQQLLSHIIAEDPRLEVAAIASSGEQALRMVERAAPDVVSLDIRLPGMDGFEVTKRVLKQRPLPIVVVASDVGDLDIPMRALAAGALAVVEKPGGVGRADYQPVARHLCTQLYIMSQVKVIRQRIERRPARPPDPAPPEALPAVQAGQPEVLALVASTGGPNALGKVLNGLPAWFPLPILVVQHIGAPFVAGFASWLESVTPFPVRVAAEGMALRPGHVHVAGGGSHLVPVRGQARLGGGEMVCGQKPSGDVLLTALARAYGARAVGVLLTGMGEDGARGLLDIRRAGGYTIAEHASTAVVHGMPGTAVKLGAAIEELPLESIAPRLCDLVAAGKEAP